MSELFGSHFGTYEIDRSNGTVSLKPFRKDPDPSPVGAAFLDLANHPERTLKPNVRRSWLAGTNDPSMRHPQMRGRDEFVEVSWNEAFDLVAGELQRVSRDFGNASIFGGSYYGWASAGRFHHAQSQIKRLLNLAGGFTSAVYTYSYGTAAVILPHVIGREYKDAGVVTPSWDQIAAHTDHLIAFGGLRLSNTQVEAGGTGSPRAAAWLMRALDRGMRLSVLSPNRTDAPVHPNVRYLPILPNTDTAVLLAMCFVILRHGLAKTPKWASSISGVPITRD